MKIRHIVIVNFRKEYQQDFEHLLKESLHIIKTLPGLLHTAVYPNESSYTPKDISSFGVEIVFENKQALDIFMSHPKHYEANALFEKYLADPPFMVLTHAIQ